MDLARRVYTRELKIAAMREIDSGRTVAEVARQLELSPKSLERWRNKRPSMGTAAGLGGPAASGFCVGAASWWSGRSRIFTRPGA
jgi:transposase-like protein